VLDVAGMGSVDWKRGAGSPVFAVNCPRVFGLSPHEPLDFRRVLRLLPKSSRAGFLAMLRKVLDHSSVLAIDVPVTLPDGRQRVVHLRAEPEFNQRSTQLGYTGIVQDVTARRMAEGKISRLVNLDERTGLPNRHQLIWRTERALEFARRHNHQVSLLHIDLDRFKIINDALDHGAGTELFNEVSRRLRSCVRHFDQVMDGSRRAMGNRSHRTLEAVGHYGDKFVALLPEVLEERDAERVASRILDLMREPIVVDDLECFVTASVGIAMFPRDGTSVADLLRNAADRAATHRGEHARQWNHQRRTEATRAIGA
jgi:GGDEF domain-containing protein